LLFRPPELPNARAFVDTWQALAREAGLPGLYLIAYVEGREWGIQYTTHEADGFDAAVYVEFPFQRTFATRVRDRLRAKNERFGPGRYHYTPHLPTPRELLPGVVHPSVQPNWDNTPRSTRRGVVAQGTSPEAFEVHLTEALRQELERETNPDRQLVMIKSWNEWAEGNYLEPDDRYGRGWLEAVRRSRHAVGLS
jgi:hypothetical protein